MKEFGIGKMLSESRIGQYIIGKNNQAREIQEAKRRNAEQQSLIAARERESVELDRILDSAEKDMVSY